MVKRHVLNVALVSSPGCAWMLRHGPACFATLLLWVTAISLAYGQSCTVYEANAGSGETSWEPTAQQAANDIVEYCNSGLTANRNCFAGYSTPPQYSGCDEDTPGDVCTAEMPGAVPTPAYGHPISVPLPVLVTIMGSSTMEQVNMGLGANVVSPCPNYFVQASMIAPPVADQGRYCPACKNDPDPVNPATGNEFLAESDIDGVGWRGQLGFMRYYNSLDTAATDMGPGWLHSFSRYLKVETITLGTATVSTTYSTQSAACTSGWNQIRNSVAGFTTATASFANGICTVSNGPRPMVLPISATPWGTSGTQFPEILAYRDDGHVISFLSNSQSFAAEPGAGLQLLPIGSNYELIDEVDNVETYSSSGKLLSIADRSGNAQTLSYSTSTGLLTSVTDVFGHALTFAYDSQNRLYTVTQPDGAFAQYSYDSSGHLSKVTDLDGGTRQYLYTDPNWATGISSVLDENDQKEFSLTYDTRGRVLTSTLGGVTASMSFTYNSNGSTVEKDPLGAQRTFQFQGLGSHDLTSAVTGAPCFKCGYVAATSYDSGGFPATERDFNGNITTYTYDDTRGLEISRTEASNTPAVARTITTQWSANYRLPTLISLYAGASATGTPVRTTAFNYDGSGNLLTKIITDPATDNTRTWTYTYDNNGRMLTAEDPDSNVTTYTYNTCATGGECGELSMVSDALHHMTSYFTYDANGRPLEINDPNGLTNLSYNHRGQLTLRNVTGETTQFFYYPTGLLEGVHLADGSSLSYTYDAAHRLTQVGDGVGNEIVYTLDAMGNRTAENTVPSYRTHTRVINSLSEVSKDINAAGTSAVTTTYGYDNDGNLTSIDAPLSRDTGETPDALNRVSSIKDPLSGETYFGYDAQDDLTSVKTPRGLATSYYYDGFGDLVSEVSPDTGTSSNTYDAAGNLATATDARGAVATYGYDALNRVISVAYSLAGTTDQMLFFTYDQGANGVGHLTGASDANHSMSFGYDSAGEMTSLSQEVNIIAIRETVSYVYTNGDLSSLTTPSGQSITYSYDTGNHVNGISVNGIPVVSSVAYEPFGPVQGWNWGNGSTGTTVTHTFDGDGDITGISNSERGIISSQEVVGYDDASRISSITNTASGSSNWSYGYDLLDRLNSAVSTSVNEGWTYDADGNRLTETGTSPSTYSIAPGNNEITGITGALSRTYSYDTTGNTKGDSVDTDTYNDAGRLKTVRNTSGTTTFIYNALGQMIEASGPSGTTVYVYDQTGHLLGEYDGSGNLIQETVWLGDIPVATLRPSSPGIGAPAVIYYVETDQLNAPRETIRPSDNTVMWTWFSGPFGRDAPNTNPQGAGTFTYDLRLPGQIAGAWGSSYQNSFRDYDPSIGRYVESDPIGLNGASFSTYSYANGNPISRIDPRGLQSVPMDPELPLYFPPVTIPGTPENNAWVQSAWHAIQQMEEAAKNAAAAIHALCTKNNDEFCHERWEHEDQRCYRWTGLGGRVVAACKVRAANRRNLCVSNGGVPNPDEPDEYNPFVDYPR